MCYVGLHRQPAGTAACSGPRTRTWIGASRRGSVSRVPHAYKREKRRRKGPSDLARVAPPGAAVCTTSRVSTGQPGPTGSGRALGAMALTRRQVGHTPPARRRRQRPCGHPNSRRPWNVTRRPSAAGRVQIGGRFRQPGGEARGVGPLGAWPARRGGRSGTLSPGRHALPVSAR